MKRIVKIVERLGYCDFIVEDIDGKQFRVQSAYKLEKAFNK